VHDDAYAMLLDQQTVAGLEDQLAHEAAAVSLRRMLIALGLLLEPLLTHGAESLDKGLRLPLPADPRQQLPVAALWLDLITQFIYRADYELAVFITTLDERPALVIGFHGVAPQTLHAVFDPAVAAGHLIDVADAAWVEESIEQDYRLTKLSTYLQQPSLSLRTVVETFDEVFVA
jgi:type VI secretion system protein ImpM